MRLLLFSVIVSLGLLLVYSNADAASELRYWESSHLKPEDYLFGASNPPSDPVFDKFNVVDLGVDLGVGSDCGRVDFASTLRGTLSNLLDSKYFSNLGSNILASSPMLLTCYFSPTWCSILKHTRINANFLSQMRLDQCQIIDKYVDSRVEDYYEERQSCVRKSISQNGGDLERAMQSCGNGMWTADLANWSGPSQGSKSGTNRLIDSSAKWAGFSSEGAKSAVNLVKSLVGDTVISRGNISVEYGPRKRALTPRTYVLELEKRTYEKLCEDIIPRIRRSGIKSDLTNIVGKSELEELNGGTDKAILVDRRSLRALSYLPLAQRELACQKLSESLSRSIFTADMNRSLDVLTTLAQNPNLPPHRKAEIEQKRKSLKDSIELTLKLQQEQNASLNRTLKQVHQEGELARHKYLENELSSDSARLQDRETKHQLMDCADGILCE